MALPQSRRAVLALLGELEPRVLGRHLPGSGVSAPGTAVAIIPAGGLNPGQEALAHLWYARIQPDDITASTWLTDLSSFVDFDELQAMFTLYFPLGQDDNPYALEIDERRRVELALRPAVSIGELGGEVNFRIDWGRAQETARTVHDLLMHAGIIDPDDPVFARVMAALWSLADDIRAYPGGPEPAYDWEAAWSTDYRRALRKVTSASGLYGGNYSSSGIGDSELLTQAQITFRA